MSAEEVQLLSSDSDPDVGYWMTPENSVDLNKADSGWTSERVARSETNTPQVGVRRIPVHELYAMPKVTQILLDDSCMDVEYWLSMKIADKMSRIENAWFINGDGTGKLHRIFTYRGRHDKSGRSSAKQ